MLNKEDIEIIDKIHNRIKSIFIDYDDFLDLLSYEVEKEDDNILKMNYTLENERNKNYIDFSIIYNSNKSLKYAYKVFEDITEEYNFLDRDFKNDLIRDLFFYEFQK